MPDFPVEDGALVRFTGDYEAASAHARALNPRAAGGDAVEADDEDEESRGRHEAPAETPIETTAAPRASDAK